MSLDPITLAVLKGRLEQIADEMDATLFRSAFNPIIAEAHDASHGLYHATTGETLIQGKSGLPVFVGSGVSPDDAPDLLRHAAGLIVGSNVKRDGVWTNTVDPDRAAALVKAARG